MQIFTDFSGLYNAQSAPLCVGTFNVLQYKEKDPSTYSPEKSRRVKELKTELEAVEKEYLKEAKPFHDSMVTLTTRIQFNRNRIEESKSAIAADESALAEVGSQLEEIMDKYDPRAIKYIADLEILEVLPINFGKTVLA